MGTLSRSQRPGFAGRCEFVGREEEEEGSLKAGTNPGAIVGAQFVSRN